MKRWTLLVLLALLPFTMAPRTSFGGAEYTLNSFVPLTHVRVGAAVPLHIEVVNTSGGDFDAGEAAFKVYLQPTVDDQVDKDDVDWIRWPDGCAWDPTTTTMTCDVPPLAQDQGATFHFIARAIAVGDLTLQLDDDERDPLTVAILPQPRPRH